jgi:LacI family transcriptional regulator
MVRLKDIAEKAGVSVMTVSKVLRDAPDISAATKARIRVLAQQMGYIPDFLAQGLRTRKTKLIGVVIPSITHPVFARLLLALEEKAFDAGYELVLCHTLSQPDRENLVIRRLISRRVDGLIVCPVYRPEATAPVYEELTRCQMPVVIIGPPAPFCQGFPSVQGDDFQASYQLTQHLIGLGHRKIAFFAGPNLLPWAQERLEGYRKALRDGGVEPSDHLVFSAGSSVEEGEAAARQMIVELVVPSAIQAVNDPVAIGAANVLLDRGWRIPEDISVAGFGNFLVSEYYRVPLTTIRQPKYRLGLAAMTMLMRAITGDKPASTKLTSEIIVRKSSATASSTAGAGI